ncbi:MAG TPA: glycosyltransferase family 4 protein [Gaiellaceae bacterium]|jgi:glycosyltransferase involved in cell wall biosynthesis
MTIKPRVLFVGRTRYEFPLDDAQRRKWDALDKVLEVRVLATGRSDDRRFDLLPSLGTNLVDAPLFYGTLPLRAARALRTFGPDAVICQSGYETAALLLARRLARSKTAIVAEVHGDWRTLTRLYGSRARRLAAPLADATARWAIRRADATRSLSSFTSSLVREVRGEPDAVFPTWTDLGVFVEAAPAPLPAEPRAVFIGALQPYKNVEGVAAVWRRVVDAMPDAVLQVIGDGPQREVVEALVRDHPANVEWSRSLQAPAVAAALDRAQLLFLPSRREGLGRVVIEALARGRPVVASRTGGIPDLVRDGENGELYDPDDHEGMAAAIVGLFANEDRLARLAVAARPSVEAWFWTPDEYAHRVRELVDVAAARV